VGECFFSGTYTGSPLNVVLNKGPLIGLLSLLLLLSHPRYVFNVTRD